MAGTRAMTRIERWRVKVLPQASGCWHWAGHHTKAGYPVFMWEPGRKTTAHRAGYRLLIGEVPDELQIDHLCRNPGCVNPEHMEPVTPLENRRRGYTARGVDLPNGRKTHCPKGHPYAGANLREYPSHRICVRCSRERSRRWHEARRSA